MNIGCLKMLTLISKIMKETLLYNLVNPYRKFVKVDELILFYLQLLKKVIRTLLHILCLKMLTLISKTLKERLRANKY